jgi:hypothetical protein
MSDANRRLTKAERREQARREREQIRQQIARRQRTRTIAIGLIVVAVAAALVAFIVIPSDDDRIAGELGAPADLVAQAEQAATAASCEDVRTVDAYPGGDQTHVEGNEIPDLSTYPSTPPTSGPHESVTLPAGVYDSPPAIGPLIHSLEHGASVIWYDPSGPRAEIDRIKAFYEQDPGDVAAGLDRVIVAPYDYEADAGAGALPDGAQMALVAWHRLRTCADPSLDVALDFTTRFSAPASLDRDYEGEAPEAGLPF